MKKNSTTLVNARAEVHNVLRPKLTLRDFLALERTMVANTRTLLSYIRTSIGILVAGLGLLKIGDLPGFCIPIGWTLVCVFPIPVIVGFIHFFAVRRRWHNFSAEFVNFQLEQKGETSDDTDKTENK